MLMIAAGALGAYLIRGLAQARPSQPERVIQAAALGAMAAVVLPLILYLARRRGAASPGRAGLLLLAGAGAALVAFYLTWISYHVEYPADFLMFAEGDFVNEITKFRTGHPLYLDQRNNESMVYTPGAPLLTYALARLVGAPDSIPVYRLIQLVYCLGAAIAAVFCFFRLMQWSGATRFAGDRGLWGAIALPLFFLVATNSITNPFVHNLHNDSLSQLAAVVSYALLLEYAANRRRLPLALMAVMPTAGFLVKQSLAIWAPLYCAYHLFFDSPRSLSRVAAFAAASFGALGLIVGGCYAIWGEPFRFWVFVVMGSQHIPPLRCIQHGMVVWAYYAIGLGAGLVFLRGSTARRLLGPWVIGLLLLGVETYTSGLNVTLSHMGAGCVIASVWFLAAVARLWSADRLLVARPGHRLAAWMRAGFAVGLVAMVYAGLGVVWMPINPLPSDAYRYVGEIEREFEGLPADKVLLDLGGGWIPERKGMVARDSAPCLGCRGDAPVGVGDFSGLMGRLERHDYQKLLIRNLDKPNFWYDGHTASQSTGIRKAIRDNYREVGRIKAVQNEKRFMVVSYEPLPWQATRYGFEEIAILVPRDPGDPGRLGSR
jgi:hypothetical protein